MTSGQETEQVYSYNPGARMGPSTTEVSINVTGIVASMVGWAWEILSDGQLTKKF